MTRRSLLTVALAAVLALALVAVAAAATKTKSKTVTVAKGATKTIVVPYPDALKNGSSKYKCSASVTSGDKSKVKITKGSESSVGADQTVSRLAPALQSGRRAS